MIEKSLLLAKYKSGLSMGQIAKELHYCPHTIVYWMRKHHIERRSRSDAAYIQANPKGNPFHITYPKTANEHFLYGLGLGIYWGEGTKATNFAVRVTNSDPGIIRTFRTFLHTICHVDTTRIRYSIVTFNDSSPNAAKSYWAKELEISPDKFGKIVQIPTQGKGTYKRKSLFGICTITVSNTKLKTWIMDELKKIKNKPD